MVAWSEFGLRDRQGPFKPCARVGITTGPDIEKADAAEIVDNPWMLRPEHALVDFQRTIEILRGLFEWPRRSRERAS